MNKLLEFLLPVGWRKRKAPEPERNDLTLGRLAESDPVYRALMDQAYVELEGAVVTLLRPDLKPEEREYWAGRAAGLAAHITGVEGWRERAAGVKAKG